MPICPRCFQQIDSLVAMVIYEQSFHLDTRGHPIYEPDPDLTRHQYFCPKCHRALAIDEEGAIQVLKGAPIGN